MRKVTLSMKSQEKYEIIKRLSEVHITETTASIKIGCTKRHISRLLSRFQTEGKSSFLHGNTGRLPIHAMTSNDKETIIALYNSKYWNTNFTHCCELLGKHDSIRVSPSCLRNILHKEFVLSPRATRKRMNRVHNNL